VAGRGVCSLIGVEGEEQAERRTSVENRRKKVFVIWAKRGVVVAISGASSLLEYS
jgi:hypothetical protein